MLGAALQATVSVPDCRSMLSAEVLEAGLQPWHMRLRLERMSSNRRFHRPSVLN